MPLRGDLRSVTIPGCVDGWVALHERFGQLALDVILTPAIRLAAGGFPAGPLLALVVTFLDDAGKRELHELVDQAVRPGAVVRRPGVALTLQAIARGGRDAFYGGAFGEGLVHRGEGLFTEADLARRQVDWVDVISTDVFGVELCSLPPNSQGYLTLGTARLAADAGLPPDPDEALWAHLLIEAATAAAYDRPAKLYEGAEATPSSQTSRNGANCSTWPAASRRFAATSEGDTTYLCTADSDGWAVSLIQSNASGFGSCLVEPATSINLQNRGLGFSLVEGHPAELAPGRRPPHTLCPGLVRREGRSPPCSARWAVTPSRRSSPNSWRGCSMANNRSRPPSPLPAGRCAVRRRDSIRGRPRCRRLLSSRTAPHRTGWRVWRHEATRSPSPVPSTVPPATPTSSSSSRTERSGRRPIHAR